MTGIFYDPQRSDESWRQIIYDGGIIILSPPSEMLALVEHPRGMIEDAFTPLDPQRAHEQLPVEQSVEILSKLNPSYIHHPRPQQLIQPLLTSSPYSPPHTSPHAPPLPHPF